MFLKNLETVGFKSFADKIDVQFVPGVTAVVGPNGSGKSNITDAIRWVLGEQSARSLRGSKMEDVIFAGSETRRSQGYAEVSLTLDNRDKTLPLEYDEVQVSRKVYRTGESEFLINKEPCRLKDIVELFMDSGLGKETFSIISQGKVEEILNSKPKDRRVIFEEAAGVLKYKQRKQKAEGKLEETEANLYRVKDILSEIEGRVEPLKRQASIASDYLEKKEDLKKEEVALLVTQIEDMDEEWKMLEETIENQRQQERKLAEKVAGQEQKIAEIREKSSYTDNSIEETHGQLLQCTKELESLTGKRELFQEKKKHYEEKKEALEHNQSKLREELKELEDLSREAEQTRTEKKQKVQNTKAELKTTASVLYEEIETIDETIESLKADYIDLLNEQAAKRNEKQHLNKRLHQLDTAHSDTRTKKLREELEDVKNQLKEVSEKLRPLEEEEQRLKDACDVKSKEWTETKNSYEEWRQKLYQGYQHMESFKSRKNALEEMKESFAGYFQGVKAVLKAREERKISGIEASVLEALSIPEEYMTAIETALGAQAQHVITENEKSARNAIEWLKKTNQGRATFLPLDAVKERFVPERTIENLRTLDGFIGVASALVEAEEKHRVIPDHLLGHIIIARDLQSANAIAKATGRKFKAVTLEGDVVNPGGSMSGGAKSGKSSSLFTQEQELKELRKKVADYDRKMQNAEKKVKNLKESMNEKEKSLRELEEENDSIKEQARRCREKEKELQFSLSNYEERLSFLDKEYSQQKEEQVRTEEDGKKIELELKDLEDKISRTSEEVDRLTLVKKEKEENRETLVAKEQELKVALATQKAEAENAEDHYAQVTSAYEEKQNALKEVEKNHTELMEFFDNKETKEEIEKKITVKKEQEKTLSDTLNNLKEKRRSYQEEMEELDTQLREDHRIHSNYLQNLQDKEVKANRLDVELENSLRYLEKEYVMTFEKAKSIYHRVDNTDEAVTRVKLIKRGIDELGNVNLSAIDEYEEVKERFDFLKDQEEDLISAKETLRNVMNEMDDEMKRKFEETFVQIRGEFNGVFNQLFGGGKADLKLTDPDDMLETGVEIIAQPPGKKLQNMSLLSGGERALTAITLLFSILKIRPVPFCVLDEVEAALDEANVDRFARFLTEFSTDTQFIVITHRKGTMEHADVLYGVTMQESGVSSVVSVRLEESESLLEV
ncbi:chromosome segregation protein SMC [Salimicrobium salexigens]|uniref:Chromosome partition protein Smc n=1 Tax=Salimicrobium salexigens TaxID=908941 RepID=A0ABY1KPP8_9BACI|nr:chromosome segregation protein SMC [Salimicrobium salexigens]SIS62733.1 condensin subunit Smc [Salimicrobium salexigens]